MRHVETPVDLSFRPAEFCLDPSSDGRTFIVDATLNRRRVDTNKPTVQFRMTMSDEWADTEDAMWSGIEWVFYKVCI